MGKTVLFHVLGEGGHLAPTLHIANKLRSRGDRVIYMTELALKKRIDEMGFEYVPFLGEFYDENAAAEADIDWYNRKDELMWNGLVSGSLQKTLGALNLDLLMYDACRVWTGLLAHKMNIPAARISTSFPMGRDFNVPPPWSDALPGELTPSEIDGEWFYYEAMCMKRPFLTQANPIAGSSLYRLIEDCNLDIAQVRMGAYGYMIDSEPELVTTSSLLDFPEATQLPSSVFAGPCMGESSDAPWASEKRRPNAPLVYCAFGGQCGSYSNMGDLLASVMAFAAARPHVDLVLAAPQSLADQLEMPANVEHLCWAPQRAILREADAFISHGGQSSIKEALWEGVPMLVCPQVYDQHGNASRVDYHKFGRRILTSRPSAEELGDAIDTLLSEPVYKSAAQNAQQRLRAEAVSNHDLAFVDDVIAGNIRTESSAAVHSRRARIERNCFGASDNVSEPSSAR